MVDTRAVRAGLLTAVGTVVTCVLLPPVVLGGLWALSQLIPPGRYGSIELLETHWQLVSVGITGAGIANLLVLAGAGFLVGFGLSRRARRATPSRRA